MKKLFLISVLVLLASLSGIAQSSSLTIFSENGDTFYLYLNGIRQNQSPETNVRVDGLINEYYNVKIDFVAENLPSLEKKTLMVVDADSKKGEVTYKIKLNKKGKLILRYFSFTPANEVKQPEESVQVVAYNTEPLPAVTLTTTETITSTTTTNGDGENAKVDVAVDGMNIGMNVTINEASTTGTTTMTTTTTTNVSSSSSNIEVNEVAVIEEKECNRMGDVDFNEVKNSINSKTFSDAKMTLAKQVVKSHCLTAAQIKQVILLFTYEADKLDFAKIAYATCFDPANYWKVNDAFEFESTIEELNEFMEQ